MDRDKAKRWGQAAASIVTAGAVALTATFALARASGRAARAAHARAGVFVEPIVSSTLWVPTLDPAQASDVASESVIAKVYAGLLKQAYDDRTHRFAIVPDLAAGMPAVTNGGTTYTFTLRPDARFSDGTPVIAQDVVSSITRAESPREHSPVAYYLYGIKGAQEYNSGKAASIAGLRALDRRTVRITLVRPYSHFLYAFTSPTTDVLEPGVPAGAHLTTTPGLVVGAGPFMLKGHTWDYRQQITLVPNPYYYNRTGIKLREVDLPFVGTVATAFAAYESGQYPMAQLPSADVARYRNTPEFHSTPILGDAWLAFNPAYKPFTSLHFRRAVAYAINRTAIVSGVLHGTQAPLLGWFPRGILGYDATVGRASGVPVYSPSTARRELALAKKELGRIPTIHYVFPLGNEDTVRVAIELQAELKAVGINMALEPVPGVTWLTDGAAHHTPLIYDGWYADYPDPQDFCDYLIKTGAGQNFGNYSNRQLDALIDRADVTQDAALRERLYKQVQLIILRQAPVAMLYQYAAQAVISRSYHGIELNPSWGPYPQPIANNWANVTVSGS